MSQYTLPSTKKCSSVVAKARLRREEKQRAAAKRATPKLSAIFSFIALCCMQDEILHASKVPFYRVNASLLSCLLFSFLFLWALEGERLAHFC